ncbi:metallophosphoesterase family protein [Devosia naphthalenivorans]|uniref:metallophosphoesterase family protein n=1 Tax=Devosia naphthalenivorans TaxID=2082392 RepID=UPI000D37D2DC|nr:DNA repair exonuclease [Devosia naphthalenivorans]
MPFRFVHTADIHLDSPLRSLSLRNSDLAGLVGDATRQALIAIVDLCLDEQVDALIIAGDLYDGDQTSMKTARFLATQLGRLHEAGIAVYKIRGNHDALSRITQELVLPPTVKVFGGRPEAMVQRWGGLDIAIHGLSFAKPQAPETLLPKYKLPEPGAVNIGIMHTSLGGAPGHDQYAPTNVADLLAAGFDYWALGHIHKRAAHDDKRPVIMPGMPQGRDINEAGEKTVTLVTVHDDRSILVEERLTSIAQFERVAVDLSGIADWREAMDAIEGQLATARATTRSPHLVARLSLTGRTPLAWQLRRDRDLVLTEAEQRAEGIGATWIEKLEISAQAPSEQGNGSAADPVLELGALMLADIGANSAARLEVRQLVEDLRNDLPAEIRGFAGKDEAELEAFVERLLSEGSQDIVARLRHDGAGNH